MAEVLIYTKPFCPYCSRALATLKARGATIREIDDAAFNAAARQEMLSRSGGKSTYPQIFIGERHVGGCDDLMALDRSGGLDPLLSA